MDLGDGGQELGDAGFGEEVFEFGAEEGGLVFEVGDEAAVFDGVFGVGVGGGGTGSAAAEVGAALGASRGEAGHDGGDVADDLAEADQERVDDGAAARVSGEGAADEGAQAGQDGGEPGREVGRECARVGGVAHGGVVIINNFLRTGFFWGGWWDAEARPTLRGPIR